MDNIATIQSPSSTPPDWLVIVREKVEGLRYGVVQLVVHEGRVTQIERTEKTRLSGPGQRDGSGI